MVRAAEPDHFMWHCEVAALVMSEFPGNAATKHHIRDALRMATLAVTGRQGVAFASDDAHLVRGAQGKQDWSKCGLVREHVVPIGEIYDLVYRSLAFPVIRQKPGVDTTGFLSFDDPRGKLGKGERTLVFGNPRAWQIADIVMKWTVLAWISKDDDLRLRNAKLHDRMPADWDGCDPFARYRACGIEWSPIGP